MYIEYITQIRHYSRKYRPRLHQIYLLLFSTMVSFASASDLGNVDSAKTRKNHPRSGIKVRPTALPWPHALDCVAAAGLGLATQYDAVTMETYYYDHQ